MAKKEFKIGEVVQFGLLKLKCVEAKQKGYCTGCYFEDIPCRAELLGNCSPKMREDKQSVIFVKEEE